MSVNNPTKNPCTRFFEWKGKVDLGHFMYYDNQLKQEVVVPFPFEFMVLDELTTVKGYCKADNGFYYANEVRSTTNGVLNVKTKKGLKASGNWLNIKGQLTGADFCKSVYVAYYEGNEIKLGNVSIMTSSLVGWFDFCKNTATDKNMVVVKGTKKAAGNEFIKFVSPEYSSRPATANEIEEAKRLNAEIQEYLAMYLQGSQDDGLTDEERDIQSQSANLG